MAARDGGVGTYPRQAGFDEHCLWQVRDRGSRYKNPIIVQNGRNREDLKGEYGPDIFCDYLLEFVERRKAEPFFVYFPMVLTHAPFVPTPDTEEWKKTSTKAHKKHFADMVAYMDKIIGRIVRKLDEAGLREYPPLVHRRQRYAPRHYDGNEGWQLYQRRQRSYDRCGYARCAYCELERHDAGGQSVSGPCGFQRYPSDNCRGERRLGWLRNRRAKFPATASRPAG